jgi:urease accessory protein
MMNELLAALQYGDSGYPAGAYAHSFGLEAAFDEGQIADADALERAVRALLTQQVARTDAVAAAACARAARRHDIAAFCEADRRLSATRAPREAREASLRIGRQMLATATACEADPWLDALAMAVARGDADGNYACVAGAILGTHGSTPDAAAAIVIWSTASGLMNAALRLGGITHVEAQRIITRLRPLAVDLARSAAASDATRMAGSAPLFEIWSMRHEAAATRLFAS